MSLFRYNSTFKGEQISMSIKEFLDKAAGNWVSPKNCQVNDILKILTAPTIDDKTYQGKTYLVMDVEHERTQQAMKLRLSGQQTQNLVGVFTDNAASWIGKRVKIISKVNYPGLGKDGFIYIPA